MAANIMTAPPHPRTPKVVLFTDSRGRNLAKHLSQADPENNINFEVQVLPGATLDTILKRVERTSRRNHWDLCIIIAGICNFTERIVNKEHRYLQYTSRKATETKEIIDQILLSQGNKISISTITPACLPKYSNYRKDQSLEIEQTNLLQDIEDTNQHIIDRNIERDQPTIHLARISYTLSKKKQGPKHKRIVKFNPKDLPDGVHPSTMLEERWAKYILVQTSKIIAKINSTNQADSQDDDDSDNDNQDSWNFKRHKIATQ
jgi:hypothetical protein